MHVALHFFWCKQLQRILRSDKKQYSHALLFCFAYDSDQLYVFQALLAYKPPCFCLIIHIHIIHLKDLQCVRLFFVLCWVSMNRWKFSYHLIFDKTKKRNIKNSKSYDDHSIYWPMFRYISYLLQCHLKYRKIIIFIHSRTRWNLMTASMLISSNLQNMVCMRCICTRTTLQSVKPNHTWITWIIWERKQLIHLEWLETDRNRFDHVLIVRAYVCAHLTLSIVVSADAICCTICRLVIYLASWSEWEDCEEKITILG